MQLADQLRQNEPQAKPAPVALDPVERLPALPPASYSSYQIQPFDTIILDFKQDSSCIAKVDPWRQISLYKQQIDPRCLISLYTNSCIGISPFEVLPDFGVADFFSELDFKAQKAERKQRQRSALSCRVSLATPFLLCERRFAQQNNKQPFMLNPASLAFLLDFAAVSESRPMVLVVDDYQGIVSAAVASCLGGAHPGPEKAACNPLPAEHGDLQENRSENAGGIAELTTTDGMQQVALNCKAALANVGEVISEDQKREVAVLRAKALDAFKSFTEVMKIPPYSKAAVVITGSTSAQTLKEALVDSNLIPSSSEATRRPRAPFTSCLSLWKFVPQDERLLDNFGVFPDPNAQNEELKQFNPLTPHNIHKLLDIDYFSFLERRMQCFNIDSDSLSKAVRVDLTKQTLSYLPRNEFAYLDVPAPIQFDSLIIASRSRPVISFKALQRMLKPGAPVAVFSESLDAMEELAAYVIKEKQGTRFQCQKLQEVAQQVLPGRTHPVMIGPLATGFCAGFYAQDVENDQGVVLGKKHDFSKNKKEKRVR